MVSRVVAVVLFVTAPAVGAVSLPLEGACKVGRFFPAVVDGDSSGLTAIGCVPVEVRSDGRPMVVPVMVASLPGPLAWPGGSSPLRVVDAGEVLVGTTTGATADDLFLAARVTPVRLDPADPLPGPTAAWECLDAVVTDNPHVARLTDDARSTLLAGGTLVASADPDRPDDRWPWARRGRWWVLAYRPVGPGESVLAPQVYDAATPWRPGRPASVRSTVATVSILATLAAATVCLWAGRWRTVTCAGMLMAVAGGVAVWRRGLTPTAVAGGDVVVIGGPLTQRDAWRYYRGLDSGKADVPLIGWTHPALFSAADSNLRLVVTPTSVSFEWPVGPDRIVAFVRRQVKPQLPPSITPPRPSAAADLARDAYVAPGVAWIGGAVAPPGSWPTAVLRRAVTKP